MKHFPKFSIYLTAMMLAVFVVSGCSKKKNKSSNPPTLTVTGGGQSADPGKAFAQEVVFQVRSGSGAPLPNVSIILEVLTDGASSAHMAGFEVMQTNQEGKAIAKAVGGNVGGFESKFKAYLSKEPSVAAEFILSTTGAPGGGGKSDGEVSGDQDAKGGGGKASGVEDGNNTGSAAGGGVNNQGDVGGNNTNSDTTPAEADIAYYLVETITTGNAPLTAGVPFGLRISAKSSTGDTVVKRDGVRQLSIELATKSTSSPSAVVAKADYPSTFGTYVPDVPTATSFTFVKGVVSLPIGQAVTIRKYLSNMVIYVIDDTSKKGETPLLNIKVGPLDSVQIALAEDTESADAGRTVVTAGTELLGQYWELQSGLPINVSPPPPPATLLDYPLAPFSTSASLALKVNGYDPFTNLYIDPILCKWSTLDVGLSVATYPTAPVFSKYLALKATRVAVNLFAPNESGNVALKVETCQTVANGLVGVKEDTTGMLSFFANKPTNLLVDFYQPTMDGNPPNTAVVMPLPAITAGKAAWMRLSATNSFGSVDPAWVGQYDITMSISSASDSAGWPLAEDSTIMNPTANVLAASYMGVPVTDNPSTTPSAHTFTVPVVFAGGYGWVRKNTGADQTAPIATRPLAGFYAYKGGEQPRVSAQDLVNNMGGTTIAAPVLPDVLYGMRLVFNDSYAVPTGYAGVYPNGINLGTSVKSYKLQVGDGRAIASWGYDQWGNRIGQEATNWSGVGMPSHFIAVPFNTKVNFLSPKDVLPAGGKIRITSVANGMVSLDSGTIIVDPGIPAKFVITPKVAPKVGTKFGINITAVDASGATALAYDTQLPLPDLSDHKIGVRISLTGVTLSPSVAWFAGGAAERTAHIDLIDEYKTGKNFNLEFVNGVAEIAVSDAEAFLFFFSAEKPVLTVTTLDTTISGTSAPITVAPEALESMKAKVLKTFTYLDPVTSTPTVYTAGDIITTIKIAAGQSVNMETIGYDKYSNILGSIPVDWSNVDDDAPTPPAPIAALAYNGSLDNFVFYQDSNYTVYAPRKAGDAYIRMTTPTGACGTTLTCNPAAGPIVGNTGVITGEIGKAVAMRVMNNDGTNTARAANFTHTVKMELLDANNQVATSFSGNVDLVQIDILSNAGEGMSVFGAANIKPAPQTVNFTSGTATLGGFQFVNMYDSPKVRIIAKDPGSTNNLANAGDTAPFIVLAAPAYTMRIISLPQNESAPAVNRGPYHRPAIFNTLLNPLAVYSGSTVKIYSGAFDIYGNWFGDINSQWDLAANCQDGVGATVANNFIPAHAVPNGAGSNSNELTILSSAPMGWACVVATKTAGGPTLTETSAGLDRINILVGVPSKLKLVLTDSAGKKMTQNFPANSASPTIEAGFKVIADEPLQLQISVHDGGGTVSAGVNDPQTYGIRLVGAQDSNGADCTIAGATKTVRHQSPGPVVETTITGATFSRLFSTSGGVVAASTIGTFVVPKAGTSFDIQVDATIGGTPMTQGLLTGLVAQPNALQAINFRSLPSGGGALLQNTSPTITADTPVLLYAAGYDRSCNFISDNASAWSATNDLSTRLVGNAVSGSSITISPKVSGGPGAVVTAVGAGVPTPDPGCTRCGKVTYTVTPGAPASIKLTSDHVVNGVNVERAGVPFKFNATFLDQHGNVATSVSGPQSFTFVWDANDATSGYQALKPSTPTYDFTAGVLVGATSFPVLTYPSAFTAPPTKRFRLAKPGETVKIDATLLGSNPPVTGTMSVLVAAGPVDSVKVYDVSSVPAAAPVPPLQLAKQVDVRPMFTLRGFDPAANDVGDLAVAWETSATVTDAFYPAVQAAPGPSHLDRVSGAVVIVTPSIMGVGTVRGTYTRVDAEVGGAAVTAYVLVNVGHGAVKKFEISAPANVIANTPFSFTVNARDSMGNLVASMPNGQSYFFSYDSATNSPSSASFAGNVPPLPVSGGAETTFAIITYGTPTAGTAVIPALTPGPNFKLTNADDRVKLKIRYNNGVTNILGESGFIDVDPNSPNFYRISKDAVGTLIDMPTDTVVVGNAMLYYANSFDVVGNFSGNASMLWKGTDVLAPIIKGPANTDLIATSMNKSSTKVRATTTGLAAEPITNNVNVTVALTAAPSTVLDTVIVTQRPAAEAKIAAYMTDASDNVAVSAGQYTIPQNVTAGLDYRYRVEVQDMFGNRADFNGTLGASVVLPSGIPAESLLGFVPNIAQPGTVTFANGLWSSGAAKLARFSKFGTVQISGLDGSASPLASVSTQVTVNKDVIASHIRIANGNLESSLILQPAAVVVDLTAGIGRTFHAAQYDNGGNWIGVATVGWAGTGVLNNPVIANGTVGSSLTVTGQSVGSANQIGLSWDHDSNIVTPPLTYALTNVNVLPSANYKDFLITGPATTVAGNCFAVSLTARDTFDNTITAYNGLRMLSFVYDGQDYTPDFAGDVNTNSYPSAATPIQFINGVSAANSVQFCLRDVTAGTTITIKDLGIPAPALPASPLTGTHTIAVTHGAAAQIQFSLGVRAGVAEPTPPPTCDIVVNADQVNIPIYATVHDQHGNIIPIGAPEQPNTTGWTWSAGGVLTGKITPVNAGRVNLTPTLASMMTQLTEVNAGLLNLQGAGALTMCGGAPGNLVVHVNPGVFHHLDVEAGVANTVRTTELFPLKITARDLNNNVSWGVDAAAVNLNVSWLNGPPISSPLLPIQGAPTPISASLVGPALVASFTNGVHTTASASRIPNANQDTLQIRVDASGKSGDTPQITVNPDTAAKVYIVKNPATGEVWADQTQQQYLTSFNMFTGKFDSLGNFIVGNEPVNWSLAGVSIVDNVTASSSLVEFNASNTPGLITIGVRTQTVGGNKVTGGNADVTITHALNTYSVRLKFMPDPATKLVATKLVDVTNAEIFNILSGSVPQVTAGQDFYVVVEARDGNDNLELTFPANFTLLANATAPTMQDISVKPPVNYSAITQLSGTFAFNYLGTGRAKIGPYKFFKAGQAHSISFTDNDPARVLTDANIPNVVVNTASHHHLTLLRGTTVPPPAPEILLDPATLANTSPNYLINTGAFDAYGNYKGNADSTYAFTWDPLCSCTIGIGGNSSPTAVITPISAGTGRLTATGSGGPTNGMVVTSPLLTIEAGAGGRFEIVALFNDQDGVTPGEQALVAGDLPNASTWRLNNPLNPSTDFQRVSVPFSLRIKAVTSGGSLQPTFCDGHLTPATTPQVCDVLVGYAVVPSNGPDSSAPAPVASSTHKVRWNNGYGTFVTDATGGLLTRPFIMRKAGEAIRITVTSVLEPSVFGTTDNITVKAGYLSEVRLRSLANDSGGLGVWYNSRPPLTPVILQETNSIDLNASGFDINQNYIADVLGNWSKVNGTGSISTVPASPASNVTKVLLTANSQGTAQVTVSVPAVTGENPIINEVLDLTLTPAPARSFKMTLVNSGCGDPIAPLEVKAGDPFKVCVEAMTGLNAGGSLATSYNGDKPLVLTAANTVPSDLGYNWVPATYVVGQPGQYNFASGISLMTGFKFTGVPLATSGNIQLVINDTINNLSGSLTIKNKLNIPGELRVRRGSLVNDAEVKEFLQFSATQREPFYAHVYDKGGNWLRLAAPADLPVWLYESGTPASPTIAPRAGLENPASLGTYVSTISNIVPVNFVPQEATNVNAARISINLTADGEALSKVISDLTVTGSTAAAFQIVPESSGNWLTTSCYRLTVKAVDGGLPTPQIAPLYAGVKNLEWTLTLNDGVTPYPTLIGGSAANELAEKSIVNLPNGGATFGGGVFEAPFASFCLRDGTGLTANKVRIKVKEVATTIEGFVDIDLSLGLKSKYAIAEQQVESKVVCDVQTIVAGTTKAYYLHELDASGNFLRQIPISLAKWAPIGDFLNVGTVNATASFGGVQLYMTKTGIGALKFDFDAPDTIGTPQILHCNPSWNIINAAPNQFVLENQDGLQGQFATEDFWVRVKVIDQFGNVHTGVNNAISLTFTGKRKANDTEDVKNSILGNQPKIAGTPSVVTSTLSATFTNGIWLDNTKLFNFPLADDEVKITVDDGPGALLPGVREVNIKAGPTATRLQIRTSSDRNGILVDSAWTTNLPTNQITTVGSKSFYTVLADTFGNYMSPTTAVLWSLPNSGPVTPAAPLAPQLTTSGTLMSGGSAVYNPDFASDGVIRAAFTGTALTVANSFDTGDITVIPAPPTKWKISGWKPSPTDSPLDIDSGVPFTTAGDVMRLKIEALDAEDTLVSDFNNAAMPIRIKFEGATPAAPPFSTTLPQMDSADMVSGVFTATNATFTAGVAYVPVRLVNKDDRVRFSVDNLSSPVLTLATSAEVKVLASTFTSLQVRYPVGFGHIPKAIKADQTLPIEVVGVDPFGNKIGNMKADLANEFTYNFTDANDYDGFPVGLPTWTTYDYFGATIDPPSLNPGALPDPINIAVLLPEKIGRGRIKVTCTDTRCVAPPIPVYYTEVITVDPGSARKFVVEVKGPTEKSPPGSPGLSYNPPWYEPNYIVNADVKFDIRVMAVDLFGNWVKTYAGTGVPLTFAYDVDGNGIQNATDNADLISPKSNLPETITAGGSTVWTFTSGVWRSIDKADPAKFFKLKRANLSATQKPYIIVTSSDGLTGRTSERLDVLPSTLSYMQFENEASKAGVPHGVPGTSVQELCPAGVCPTAVTPLSAKVGDELRLYMAGYDVQGNYIADQKVDWGVPTVSSPLVSPVPLAGRTNLQSLSACQPVASGPTGAFCNSPTNSMRLARSFYALFKPETVGDYLVTAVAVDGADAALVPTIKTQLHVTLGAGAETKFKAFVVYDENANAIEDETVVAGSGSPADPFVVEAGKCFRLKIKALDANNNDTAYAGTKSLDFFSDAPIGSTGFAPTPYGSPVLNTLTFAAGTAWSDLIVNGTHTCGQASTRGSFQFMRATTNDTQTRFIRVSDGAGVGLDDDEVTIRVVPSATDFVALMAGNPVTPDAGVMIGNSKTFTAGADGYDITIPGNWTAPIPCTSIDELLGKCSTMAGVGISYPMVNRVAGQAPATSINFHRFFLASFDKGGNFIESPAGDWSTSKVTMGEVLSTDPQWTTPRTSVTAWSPQYVNSSETVQANIAADYSNRGNDVGAAEIVTSTSSIFYYPIKPKSGRITVKNVLTGGKYFYVNARATMNTDSKAHSKTVIQVTETYPVPYGRFLAGSGIPVRVSLFDDFNNPAYNAGGSTVATISVRICDYLDTTCATNIGSSSGGRIIHPIAGLSALTTPATETYKQYVASETRILNAGKYKLRADATYNSVLVSEVLPYDIEIFPGAPVSRVIMPDSRTNFVGSGNPCYTTSTVESPQTYKAVVVDDYGNTTPYKHGWVQLNQGGASCSGVVTDSNTSNNMGFGNGIDTISFLDAANGPAVMTGSGNGTWCYSEKATIQHRRAFVSTAKSSLSYGGSFPQFFTYGTLNANHPLAASNYDLWSAVNVPIMVPPSSASITECSHTHYAYAGPPRQIDAWYMATGQSWELGDMFTIGINPKDKWFNNATMANGYSANFSITFDPATTLNAPDMCAARGVAAGAACDAQKVKVVGGSARAWQASHQLASTGSQSITFASSVQNPYLSSEGFTGANYRMVNKSIQPKFNVCYVGGATGGSLSNLVGACDNNNFVSFSDSATIEVFATSSAGAGYFFDTAQTMNASNVNADKTFLANETTTVYAGLYDKFGNYNGPASNPSFSLIDQGGGNKVWGSDGITFVADADFTTQWTNWSNGNPLTLGTVGRLARSAEMKLTVGSFVPVNLGKFDLVEAPAGPAVVKIYPATTGAEYGTNPSILAGTQFYYSIEVRNNQNQRLSSFTGDSTVTFSHTVTATRDFKTGVFPVTGIRRFCNGIMVAPAFDLVTNCPGNGNAPASVDIYREGLKIESASFSNPAFSVNVNVNGQSSIGGIPNITITPDVVSYFFALSPTESFNRTLNASMAFVEGPANINVRAADQFGNLTTNGLGSASAVSLGIFNSAAFAQTNVCTNGTLGSCPLAENIFKCGASVGNCLQKTVDMTSGSAVVSNLEFDGTGVFYIAFGQGQATKTFTTVGEMNSRATRLTVGCTTACINRFDLVFNTPQNIGTSFNLGVKMVDVNGRVIQDAGLNAIMSTEVLTWNAALLTRINGGLPDNRAAIGFGPGTGDFSLNFIGGSASIPNMTINQPNAGGSALTPAVFQFVIKNTPAKTSLAPGNLEVLASAVTEYRITSTAGASVDATPSGLFNVTVSSIDRGGTFVNNPTDATIVPVKVSGPAPTTGSFEGPSNTCTLVAGQCTFTNLYYRVPNVTDVKVSGYTSISSPAPRISFTFMPATIKSYEMSMSATPWAYDASLTPPGGTSKTTATVRARDGADTYISSYSSLTTARDADLNGYTWTSANSAAGWPSTKFCPTRATWVNGVTTCDVEILKAGNITASNLSLQVNAIETVKTFSGVVVVAPNIINTIRVCSTQNGCASTTTAANDTADNTATSFYINGYDFFGNLRNAGFGETTGTAWAIQTPTTPPGLVSPTDYNFTSTAGTNGGFSFLGYTVPGSPTQYTIRATAPAPAVQQDLVVSVVNPTAISILKIEAPLPNLVNVQTGQQISVSNVRAYYSANGVDRLKTDLNGAQTLTVTHDLLTHGTATIPATVSCTFVAGVCSTVNNFTMSIPQTGKFLSLSYGGQTATLTPISVVPSAPTKLVVSAVGGLTVTAGTAFSALVSANDLYDNLATNYSSPITIDFIWNNTTNTVSANLNGQAPNKPASTSYAFAGGTTTVSGFMLKRRHVDTGGKNTGFATLGINTHNSGTVTSTFATGAFTINAAATVDFVRIMAASTVDQLYTSEITTFSMTTAATKQLWTAGFDSYGNWIGLQTGNWTAPSVLNGRLGPVTGVDNIVVDPLTVGTDTISVNAGGKVDSTGVFTITPATATVFTFASFPTTATAGTDVTGWTIQARDPKGNIDTNYTGVKTVTWTWVPADISPSPSNTAPVVGTSSVTFATGTASAPVGFKLYKAATGLTTKLRASAAGISASDSSDITTVNSAVIFRYRLTGVTTTQTAGTAFGGTVTATDQWDNLKNVGANPNLTFTWTGTTATSSRNGAGNALAPLPSAAQTIAFAGGSSASTGNIFQLRKASMTGFDTNAQLGITFSSDGVTNFNTGPATVGPFTINPAGSTDYIVVHNTATANTAWTPEYTTGSLTADATLTLYSHSYDMYGNPKGLINSSWAGTGVISGRVSPTSASSSTTFTPLTTGTGDVTATAAATTPSDATGTITVTSGALASFVVTAPGAATAGANVPITVTAKDALGNTKTDFTGSQAIVWTWNSATNAPSGAAPKSPAGNVTFSVGAYTSVANDFILYNAANTNVSLKAKLGTPEGTSGNIATVGVGAVNNLVVNSISATTVSAGDLITATLHLRDTWQNLTSGNTNCSVAASGWATSPGHSGAPATAPVYPGSISPSGTGVFPISANLRLYNAASTNLVFTASGGECGGGIAVNQAMTVNPLSATVDHIWLSDVNSIPGSHLGSKTCTGGASPSCTLYSFAWDPYGNNIGSTTYSCPSWTYTDGFGHGMTGFTLPSGSHTGALTASTWHIGGDMKCTAGGTNSPNTAVQAPITKNATYNCAAWSCNVGAVQRTCNLNNATGYNFASASYGYGAGNSSTGCEGALTTGNNCNATVTGTPGSALATATATITASTPANVTIPAPTFTDAAAAPSCTNTLATSTQAGWACRNADKKGIFTARATNNNGLVNATFNAGTWNVGPNNMVIETDGCNASGAAFGGGTCDVLVRYDGSGADTATLQFNPVSYFGTATHNIPSAPNCIATVSLVSKVLGANDCGVPVTGDSSRKITYTLQNNNSFNTATFTSIVDNSGLGVISANTCNTTLAVAASCTFDVTYSAAALALVGADTTNISVNMGGTYFTNTSIGTGGTSNKCP